MARPRKKPLLVWPGQAQALGGLLDLLLRGEGGIECSKSGNVWSIALRAQKGAGNVPGGLAPPNERAKITDYDPDGEYQFLGQRLSPDGTPVRDADGVEIPPAVIYVWAYEPGHPIWQYFPSIKPGDIVPVAPYIIEVGGENETRWYVTLGFQYIGCEK